jgi:hypothetical protein
MEERRVFARIKIKIPIKFLVLPEGKEGQAETVDISANGVGFVTKDDLAVKNALEMWLDLPDHHEPLHVLGKVAWSKDTGDNIHQRVGVHLGEERPIGLGRVWLYKETHADKI